jgi:hypothetical protein
MFTMLTMWYNVSALVGSLEDTAVCSELESNDVHGGDIAVGNSTHV